MKPNHFGAEEPAGMGYVSAAMTYYFIEFAGDPVKIVSADGTDVQPVGINRFLMTIAETYDLLIKVPAGGSYELRSTAQDGTGHTSLFSGSGDRKAAPEVPRANPYLNHSMMGGMDHSSMPGMDMSGDKPPMKHTVDVPPMSTRVIEFAADEPGWIQMASFIFTAVPQAEYGSP